MLRKVLICMFVLCDVKPDSNKQTDTALTSLPSPWTLSLSLNLFISLSLYFLPLSFTLFLLLSLYFSLSISLSVSH